MYQNYRLHYAKLSERKQKTFDEISPRQKINKQSGSLSLRDKIYSAVETNSLGTCMNLLRYGKITEEQKKWIFFLSARFGRIQFIKMILGTGFNINTLDINGHNALLLAIFNNHPELVETLLQANCNATIRTAGKMPLHVAAERGFTECVRKLIPYVTSYKDAIDHSGCTPLTLAIKNNHVSSAAVLIKAKCNVNFMAVGNYLYKKPLHFAASNNNGKLAKMLLEAGADPTVFDAEESTPLLLSIMWRSPKNLPSDDATSTDSKSPSQNTESRKAGLANQNKRLSVTDDNYDAAEIIIAVEPNRLVHVNKPNQHGITPVIAASWHNENNLMVSLLNAGADPDFYSNGKEPAIVVAARKKSTSAIDALLEAGCKVNVCPHGGKTALTWGAIHGLEDSVEKLLKSGADPNLGDEPPLRFAAFKGYIRIAEMLLRYGALVDKREVTQDATSLLYAIDGNNYDIAELLVSNGADINAKTAQKVSAQLLAASDDYIPDYLLNKKTEINAENTKGMSILQYAASRQKPQAVHQLLCAGADPDIRDHAKTTPLIGAIGKGYEEEKRFQIISELVKANCNINARGTPYRACELALILGDFEIAEIFIQLGCDLSFVNAWRKTTLPLSFTEKKEKGNEVLNQALQPPSLLQLCRQCIRNNLGKGLHIQDRVTKLVLPNEIKDYLKLKDLKLYSPSQSPTLKTFESKNDE